MPHLHAPAHTWRSLIELVFDSADFRSIIATVTMRHNGNLDSPAHGCRLLRWSCWGIESASRYDNSGLRTGLVGFLLLCGSLAAEGATLIPKVAGPLPVTNDSYPFGAAAHARSGRSMAIRNQLVASRSFKTY